MKKYFSAFKHKKKFFFLDAGASTQTPYAVTNAMSDYYLTYRANIHRGVYAESIKATEQYEAARRAVASFINAAPEEVIFTSGTTFGLNQLAYSLSPRFSHRDNVVLSRAEHHANLVPWQQMAKHYGFEIRFIDIDKKTLQFDPKSYSVIDENTRAVSLVHVSNVLGFINPVHEVFAIAKKRNPKVYTILDAAQSASHTPLNVKKLGCDFLAFSGHKMYAPTGIGILFGRSELLHEHLEPFIFGGDMVKSVSFREAIWNDVPGRFEAGTPNIAGAIGLGAAVSFMKKIGWKKIQAHEKALTRRALAAIHDLGFTTIGPGFSKNRVGVIAFVVPGVHPHDVADILSHRHVCVRAGFHCAEPLQHYLGADHGTVRASLGMYNDARDITELVAGLRDVKKLFKV